MNKGNLILVATAVLAIIFPPKIVSSQEDKPEELKEELRNFDPYWYYVTVDNVVDADTIDVTVDLGFDTQRKERLRIFGINAWETRGEEREIGLLAKEAVQDLCPTGKKVVLHTIKDKRGKYGRYLGILYVDGVQLNTWIVENGHGKYQEY